MPSWFHCDNASGAVINCGIATEEDAQKQKAPEGQTLFVLPDGLVGSPFAETPDFTNLRNYLRVKVDREVGTLREQYVTDVSGQAQTYEKKEAEARQWTSGDEATHPERYPFMIREATVRGLGVDVVQAQIMEQVNQLTPLATLIEAHRVNAKQLVLAAGTLPAIVAAGEVDWANILASLQPD